MSRVLAARKPLAAKTSTAGAHADVSIGESTLIIQYLDEAFPAPPLPVTGDLLILLTNTAAA